MKQPVILDCDGVLLDWERGFREWLGSKHGRVLCAKGPTSWDLSSWTGLPHAETMDFIKRFARTRSFRELVPLPGAIETVQALRKRGHPLFVLTSCDSKASEARQANLDFWFKDAFQNVCCLDLGKSKRSILKAAQEFVGPCYWVEDNMKNAIDGHLEGHKAFLIKQRHNTAHHSGSEAVIRLDSFSDLMSHIK